MTDDLNATYLEAQRAIETRALGRLWDDLQKEDHREAAAVAEETPQLSWSERLTMAECVSRDVSYGPHLCRKALKEIVRLRAQVARLEAQNAG